MAKRTASEFLAASGADDGQASAKAPASKPRRVPESVDEMGEFEDAWEDELESDEDVVDAGDDAEGGVCVLPASSRNGLISIPRYGRRRAFIRRRRIC